MARPGYLSWYEPTADKFYKRDAATRMADEKRWGSHVYSPEEFCDRIAKSDRLNRSERRMLMRVAAIICDPDKADVTVMDLRQISGFGYLKGQVGAVDKFGAKSLSPLAKETARLLAKIAEMQGQVINIKTGEAQSRYRDSGVLKSAEVWCRAYNRRYSYSKYERLQMQNLLWYMCRPDEQMPKALFEEALEQKLIVRGEKHKARGDYSTADLSEKGRWIVAHLTGPNPTAPRIDPMVIHDHITSGLDVSPTIRMGKDVPKGMVAKSGAISYADSFKRCQGCQVSRPVGDYLKVKNTKSGEGSWLGALCGRCRERQDQTRVLPDRSVKERDIPLSKKCGCNFPFGCGNRELPAERFKRNASDKSGLSSYCRDCTRKYKKWSRALKGGKAPGATVGASDTRKAGSKHRSDIAEVLANEPVNVECPNCRKPFLRWRKSQVFCSVGCRADAARNPAVLISGFPHIRCISCGILKVEHREFDEDRDFNFCKACVDDPLVDLDNPPEGGWSAGIADPSRTAQILKEAEQGRSRSKNATGSRRMEYSIGTQEKKG